MLEQLTRGTEAERVQAAMALGDLDFSPRTTDRLLRALGDSSIRVRIAAAGALAKWRDAPASRARVHAAVAPALSDSDPDVRSAGTRTLAEEPWRDSTVASLIIPLLQDSNVGVRASSAQALGSLGMLGLPAIDALQRASRDSSDYVREEARSALRALRAVPSA